MKIILLILFLIPIISKAQIVEACGIYNFRGVVRMIDYSPFLIVNEHTLSEYKFSIPISEEPRIAPYIDRAFELTATIEKRMDGTKGAVKNIQDIDYRVSDPLGETPDTGVKLIKKISCK